MAHWAELDNNNIVLRVLVGNNDEPDEGLVWLEKNLGGRWEKTSYNTVGGVHLNGGTPYRKNYAGVGYTFDETRDAFIPPKPLSSWILNEETCLWEPPIPKPSEGVWYWNEESVSWVEVTE
jgi:hypothetical protein